MVVVIAMGMSGTVAAPVSVPTTPWAMAVGIGGELAFGLAMGMLMSFVFIATQWAGEIIGQQMGFNLSEVFDPQFGAQGSLIGDAYFMLTTVIFLIVGGHRVMLIAVQESFRAAAAAFCWASISRCFSCSFICFPPPTVLAMRSASPMLVTMLVVDLSLGLIGKTMPQMNIMTIGLNLRSAVGIVVVVIGLTLTVSVMRNSVLQAMEQVREGWTTACVPVAKT